MKRKISLLLLLCIVLGGCGKASTKTSTDEIVLQDNQSLKYGQVTSINGNELTIALAKEVSSSDMRSQRGDKNQAAGNANATSKPSGNSSGNTSGNTSGTTSDKTSGNTSENGAPGAPGDDMPGNPPGESAGGGDMQNGGGPDGEMASNQQAQNGGNRSQDSASGKQNRTDKKDSSTDGSSKNRVMYQLTGEEETLTIPVGTKVTTSLGTTTTFSRIASNDTLKFLMQKDESGKEVVVGVWIVA